MKIRELLQTEIWSKRTTRKILVRSGSVLGVVVVVFAIWLAVEWYWFTPGERKSSRAAIAQIDSMQALEPMSQPQFDSMAREAKEKVEGAKQAAWTIRDKDVAYALEAYLFLTTTEQECLQRRREIELKYPSLALSDVETAQEITTANRQARGTVRITLHSYLD
jgi:hypothetical protein